MSGGAKLHANPNPLSRFVVLVSRKVLHVASQGSDAQGSDQKSCNIQFSQDNLRDVHVYMYTYDDVSPGVQELELAHTTHARCLTVEFIENLLEQVRTYPDGHTPRFKMKAQLTGQLGSMLCCI